MKQPSTQSVYDLFNARIQFVVPVYQRPYVWNENDNWAPMWEDITQIADRFLARADAGPHDRHFLGPIVLEQQHHDPGGVDMRLVIDGQQRLTTLQVLLSAARDVARDVGADEVAADLSELTANKGSSVRGELRYKLRPSRRDRAGFVDAMQVGGPADDAEHRGTRGAYDYFAVRIREWINGEDAEEQSAPSDTLKERTEALHRCLDGLLYVVSINLDETDNAQVIFETLNARGTGLGALDLVKNAAFLAVQQENGPADQLHEQHWTPTFEADDHWVEEERQGRQRRARADWFLMHWMAVETEDVVRVDSLFNVFRRDLLNGRRPVPELVYRLCADARVMRSFSDLTPGTPEQLFFSRMQDLDTTTMLPVALLLFRSEEVTPDRRRRALAALESWLVRRALLRLTGKNYNRLLVALLRAVKSDLAHADDAVIAVLAGSTATTALWPGDDEVRHRLVERDLYGYVGQVRVRMVLEACELDLRDDARTERVTLPDGLSIEHLMPQKWDEHWPLLERADDEATIEDRNARVNRLGNLTLVTQPLNASMSNGPWLGSETGTGKRDALGRSVLLLNNDLRNTSSWAEEDIDRRGVDLAERVLRIWPGPSAW